VNVHHRRALWVLGATVALDLALGVGFGLSDHIGVWHGLYCATGTGTTVGCDVDPSGWLPHVLSTLMMLTVVPLFTSVFAFFTTGLTADHIDVRHEELKDRPRYEPRDP
jgi:hypothetical protein